MHKNEKTMIQTSNLRHVRPLWTIFAALVFVLTLGATPVLAEETPVELDPEAKAILMEMAEFIAKAPAFSMTLRSSYDAIQEDGQYIEFGEKRHILLQRPDRLRVETERSDGERGLVLFDGKEITIFKPDDNVYTQIEKPGTVDDFLVYLVRDLQFTLASGTDAPHRFRAADRKKDHSDQLRGGGYPLRCRDRSSGHPLGRGRYATVGGAG